MSEAVLSSFLRIDQQPVVYEQEDVGFVVVGDIGDIEFARLDGASAIPPKAAAGIGLALKYRPVEHATKALVLLVPKHNLHAVLLDLSNKELVAPITVKVAEIDIREMAIVCRGLVGGSLLEGNARLAGPENAASLFAQQEELAVRMPQHVVAAPVGETRINANILPPARPNAHATVVHQLFGLAEPDRLLCIRAELTQGDEGRTGLRWSLYDAIQRASGWARCLALPPASVSVLGGEGDRGNWPFLPHDYG